MPRLRSPTNTCSAGSIMVTLLVTLDVAGLAAGEVEWHSKPHRFRVPFQTPDGMEEGGLRLASFPSMLMVLGDLFVVTDLQGEKVPVAVDKQTKQAWIHARRGQRYFLYFSGPLEKEGLPKGVEFRFDTLPTPGLVQKTPEITIQDQMEKDDELDDPLVESVRTEYPRAVYGKIESPPVWKWQDGAVRKVAGRGPLSLPYLDADWGDCNIELSVRYSTAWVGVSFRVPPAGLKNMHSATWIARSYSSRIWRHPLPMPINSRLKKGWNTMRVELRGRQASLLMNGDRVKEITLSERTPLTGGIRLYAAGSTAFDSVKVTTPDGRALLHDTFDARQEHWRLEDMPFACMRLVNTQSESCRFHIHAVVHGTPWRRGNGFLGTDAYTARYDTDDFFEQGEASVWIPLNSLRSSTFSWFCFRYSEKMARVPFAGRIEITGNPFVKDVELLSHYDIKAGERKIGFGFEVDRNNFAEPRTLLETETETAALVESFAVKGKRPKKFPVGAVGYIANLLETGEALLRTGAALGFSSASVVPEAMVKKFGYAFTTGYSHAIREPGPNLGYDLDKMIAAFRKTKDHYDRLGIKVDDFGVCDEPGMDIFGAMQPKPKEEMADQSTWHWQQAMEGASSFSGIPLEFFGRGEGFDVQRPDTFNDHWKLFYNTPENRARHPLEVFQSALLLRGFWPCRLGHAAYAAKQVFRKDVRVHANIHTRRLFRGQQSGIDMITTYRPMRSYWRPDAPTAVNCPQACDYETFNGPASVGYLIDVFRATEHYGGKTVTAMLASQSSYFPTPPLHLLKRGFISVGAGADCMSFFAYGPRYTATENWYSTSPPRLKAIRRICHMIGFAEDVLVGSRPPASPVAMVMSDTDAIWSCLKQEESLSADNNRWAYMMLRHLGHQVDFLAETQLLNPDAFGGKDCAVKVLFITQHYMRKACAARLTEWVKDGGTLIAINGIGETSEELSVNQNMLALFGYKAMTAAEGEGAVTEMITMARTGTHAESLTIYSPWRARGKVSTASILASFGDGSPAITVNKHGNGRAIAVNASLPQTFVHSRDWKKLKSDERDGSPLNYSSKATNLLAKLLALAGPPPRAAFTSNPYVDARLRIHRKMNAAVLTLVDNSNQEASKGITITLRPGLKVKMITSLHHGELGFESTGKTVALNHAFEDVDVLLLQ